MNPHDTIYKLQLHLQHYGALQPEAWQQIQQQLQIRQLKPNESFIRKEGSFAYIAEGLLKEYDSTDRSLPSIVSFIAPQTCIITRRHNQTYYLKACIPTLIYYLDFEQLQQLYIEFKELKSIYDNLIEIYDALSAFRQLILETPSAAQKIYMFRKKYSYQINYLKKKDIANYLQLNYTHFLHINNNLP